MPRIKTIHAPMTQGVTQQAAALRPPPGITTATNVDFSVLRGATKRGPTRYVAELESGSAPEYRFETWVRGDGGAYTAGVHETGIKVWDADTGSEYFLDDAVGDFDYLAGVSSPNDFVMRAAGDYLFVLNKRITVGTLATTSPSRATPGYGFFFVSRGNYDRDYVIRIKIGGIEYAYTCNTYQAVASPFAGPLGPVGTGSINSVKTEDIAEDLRLQINAATGAHGVVATRVGSVVKLSAASAITSLTASDGEGDTALIALLNGVELVSQLPTICEDGFRLRVTGEGKRTVDDYFVQFVSDESGTFGAGSWRETVAYDVETDLDPSTMPHALTRNVDTDGSVTGTPGEVFFRWQTVPWESRAVGDLESNPWPSFVGNAISGLFHWQDRLGFLSDVNVVMSETSEPFNFFRTTVRDLVDSDRIDVAQAGSTVSLFHSATPHEDTLLLLSRKAVFIGSFEGTLSPSSFFIREIGPTESDPDVAPVTAGRSLFFIQNRGPYSALRELVRSGDTFRFAQADATVQCPSFVPAEPDILVAAPGSDLLFIHSPEDAQSVYVHRFFWSGEQKLQSSWTRYAFSCPVVGLGVVGSDLRIVLDRGANGIHLESMSLNVDERDDGVEWLACIDSRFDDQRAGITAVYDGGSNATTISLPYALVSGEAVVVLTKDGGECSIVGQSGTGVSPAWVEVSGDKTSEDLWLGVQYAGSFVIDKPLLKESTETGRYGTSDPVAQVLSGAFQHADSGPYTVNVDFTDSRHFESTSGPNVGGPGVVVGSVVLLSGSHVFSVMGREDEVGIQVYSDSPIQFAIQGVSWTHRVSSRARGRF